MFLPRTPSLFDCPAYVTPIAFGRYAAPSLVLNVDYIAECKHFGDAY